MNIVELAFKVAKKAHLRQVDKAGVDYIKHPTTVASFVKTDEEKATAYLHDVIEDTSLTLLDLEEHGFPRSVIEAIDILTKKKGQDYQSYLNLVKTNRLARTVKLADLKHNSDLSRLSEVTDKDLKRYKKYQEAIKYLNN